MEEYQKRLLEERQECGERIKRLGIFISKLYSGETDVKLKYPVAVLEDQLMHMKGVYYDLDTRIQAEGIDDGYTVEWTI